MYSNLKIQNLLSYSILLSSDNVVLNSVCASREFFFFEKSIFLLLICSAIVFVPLLILPFIFTRQRDFTPIQHDFAPILTFDYVQNHVDL